MTDAYKASSDDCRREFRQNYLLVFFIAILPSCSLIFSEGPDNSLGSDGGKARVDAKEGSIDASLDTDAMSTSCEAQSIGNIIAYYSLSGQEGKKEISTAIPVVQKFEASSKIYLLDSHNPVNLDDTSGPPFEACRGTGAAADFKNGNRYIEIIKHGTDFANTKSVDFWFLGYQLPPNNLKQTLLSKDQPGTNTNGDFNLSLEGDDTGDYNLILRLQEKDKNNDGCRWTGTILAGNASIWHHVAINFFQKAVSAGAEGQAVELFIDGAKVTGNPVCADNVSPDINLMGNSNDWLWGASNSSSIVRNFFNGVVDELYIRDKQLTPSDVSKIYQSVFPSSR